MTHEWFLCPPHVNTWNAPLNCYVHCAYLAARYNNKMEVNVAGTCGSTCYTNNAPWLSPSPAFRWYAAFSRLPCFYVDCVPLRDGHFSCVTSNVVYLCLAGWQQKSTACTQLIFWRAPIEEKCLRRNVMRNPGPYFSDLYVLMSLVGLSWMSPPPSPNPQLDFW